MKRIYRLLLPHWGPLAVAVAVGLLTSLAVFAYPLVLRPALDALGHGRRFDAGAMDTTVLILAAVLVTQRILTALHEYILTATGERVAAAMRLSLFEHLVALPATFFATARTGELAGRWANDITTIQTLVTRTLFALVRSALMVAVSLVLLTVFQWKLTVEIALLVVPLAAIAALTTNTLAKYTKDVQSARATTTAVVSETLTNLPVVKSFNRLTASALRLDAQLRVGIAAAIGRARFAALVMPLQNLVATAVLGALVYFEARAVVAGSVKPADLFTYVFLIGLFGTAAAQLSSALSQARTSFATLSRVFALLELPAEQIESGIVPARASGELELCGVTFRYAAGGAAVLDDLSLRIEPGTSCGIVGASGCGKSTLVGLVNGTYRPTAGRMLLDREEVSSLQLSWLRDAIAYVPQDPYLFTGTIRENLLFAAPAADDAALLAALRSVALGELLERLPAGLDTEIGEAGKLLSRGEGQRLSIARLLLKDAPIAILDEPTASLDAATQRVLSDVIRLHLRGRTSIIISHQLNVVAQCDRIAVLFEGRVAEHDTHDALLRAGGLYATLHAMQNEPGPALVGAAA